ncbi:GTPase IMAP family member 8-like [Alosa pseudoharengus]|uniref:GTPase IMAP family member 8-like n=1 Tax=Alosa pseudoharengus TaxID=34774 RepID=UPI003F88EF29
MSKEEHHRQHELRAVVLGGMYSGKTYLIETVLGLAKPESAKRSAHNLKNEGTVWSRKLVLVNTHGWWRNLQMTDTAEFIKQELVQSVFHCPPGPHAFILTVMIDMPFDEDNRRAVEQHMGLFGENIWKHTIVVFTRGESLMGKTIEQYIESEGKALKWVLEKCGNRYSVSDQKSKDQNQVIQLLEKIESVVVSNSGRHFELDGKSVKQIEEKKKDIMERALARFKRSFKYRGKQSAEVRVISEIRILLLGWVSSRKTSAKNIILDKMENVTKRTTSVQTQTGEVAGQKVSVVDTPGWWKYLPAQSTPREMKRELWKSLSLGSRAPHAILLAVPADTTFPEEQRKITEDNMKMFGEQVWRHTIVLFTCGDLLRNTTIEEHIESEGEPLRWLVEKCGNRYHVFDNINRGDGSQVTELLDKIIEMEARNSSPAAETEETEVMGTTEPEGLDVEMGKVLDNEWNRMDRKIEMKISKLWNQSIGLKGNRSIDAVVDFKANGSSQKSSDKSPEKNSSVFGESPFKSVASDKKHTLEEETQRPSDLTSKVHSDLLEKMKDKLEREWGRREAVIVERAWGIFLKTSASHDMTSEPGEHEYEQSKKKVCRWLTGSSGFGSEAEDNDTNLLCEKL